MAEDVSESMTSLFRWMHTQVRSIARQAGIDVAEPASSEAIAEAVRSHGRPLPPSVAQFLALQNGTGDLWQGIRLLSTHSLCGRGPFGRALTQQKAAWDKTVGGAAAIDPRPHLVVGRAIDGALLVLTDADANAAGSGSGSQGGEPEAVYLTAEGEVGQRFASFSDFLQSVVEGRLPAGSDDAATAVA